MTTQITLQPEYKATSFQTQFDFQDKTMIFVSAIHKYSAFINW